jgi:pre-rRNA-processing protein IPI3
VIKAMLRESVLVSSLRPEKIPTHLPNKDVGIWTYEINPTVSLKSSWKKSSVPPNCLAANQSHIFAAQADKAVVHIYNVSKGNQEGLVPFREKITSLVLIGGNEDAGILALGTANGNVIFWEVCGHNHRDT